MARTKQVGKRKRRRITLPVLGAAGASLAMVGGTSATAPTANVPSQATEPRPVITLDEEEISDVSLATFYIFDKENAELGEGLKLAARGCGGCAARGCGGCAARGCGGCAARGCRGCAVRGCERLRLRRLRRRGLRKLRRLRRRLRNLLGMDAPGLGHCLLTGKREAGLIQ